MKQSRILEACIVAAAIVVFGLLLKAAVDNFTNKDRRVTVKGLSEIEVPADQVTWSITTAETGNDLQQVYANSSAVIKKIRKFLTSNGIKNEEISVGTPVVTDNETDRWNADRIPFRFKIKTVLSVNSGNVDKVRELISRQGELLQQGIAIINDGYMNPVSYSFVSFQEMKPKMMEEAIANAQKTANQFASTSGSKLGKIIAADQGQFSINSKDENNPEIKKLRVVTTITYQLKN
ncbi:MAG: SIMPL domain-containing protein [Bacteroidales bacterium]|nr:SIMPL domain-containing protein [Bacteroidales bacterium]